MKTTKLFSLSFLVLLFAAAGAYAQLETPRSSPAASVTQQVGFTKITIEYSSPGVKGRTIFGDLVPYGNPWRAGANAPTKITFSNAVKIGGEFVGAGSYNIFITPVENGQWQIHFNGENKSLYNYMQDGKVDKEAMMKDDAATVGAQPEKLSSQRERLVYVISAEDNNEAKIMMEWADIRLPFTVDVRTSEIVNQIQENLQ